MRTLDQFIARFGLRVLLPAIVVLIGALAIVIISLSEMADEVNRIEDRLTGRSVDAAVAATLRRVGETHNDYAVWDDAVRNLYGAINRGFVAESYVSSTEDGIVFDTFFLLDESRRTVLGYSDGRPVARSAEDVYGPALARLLRNLPADGIAYAVNTGMIATQDGIVVAAAGPVVPFSEGYAPQPAAARLLVISTRFDGAAVSQLGDDFLIDGLRLADGGDAGPRSVAVTDAEGHEIGRLTWTSRGLGDEAQARVSPAVFVMLALVCAIVVALIAIARRSLREIQRREAEARHSATHDALTGLPNRAAAVAAIDAAIEGREGGMQVAAIHVDLDRFKEVDDSYGHETGDRLLTEVARSFAACLDDHLLARVGGDEFVVVVSDRKATKSACDIAWKLIETLREPFVIDGRIIPIAASIGIAVADTIDPTAEELLRRADVAMVQAKRQGSNRFFVYDPVVDAIRHERLEIADDLRRALKAGSLSLSYQPIFDAATREIVAVEALLRWDRPLFGPVSPATLIPIAEEAGLIDELSRWTLRRACAEACRWPRIRVAVNVSPVQFRTPDFENQVSAILAETGLPAERLELEIVEGSGCGRREQVRRTVEAIRERGMSVALDDFGRESSSIHDLRVYALDRIKLDRSLIAGIVHDKRSRQLVHATVALARALDLKVTAEVVESEAEARLLAEAGCTELQGGALGEPGPADDIAARLDRASGPGALAASA